MNFMSKKVKIMLFTVLVLGALPVLWLWIPVCPMRAVFNVWVEHEQKLIAVSSENLNAPNVEALVETLASNEEQFLICGNKVMVTPKLFFDKELLWNYTTKSGISYPDVSYYRDHEHNLWRHK